MKTIEERANEHFAHGWEGSIIDAYVQGATAQKVIDDRECETMVGYAVNECKQVLIDKACEWMEGNLGYYNRNEVHIGKSYEQCVIDDFRKAMEE